jgi:predicted RNA polymerase sigma factor
MLALVAQQPALAIRILSGLEAGLIEQAISAPDMTVGTRISR